MANIPQRIGNYTLEHELGRGGTSEVYLARHRYLDDRLVAIKILMSQDNEAIERFTREASLTSQLRHPNIVQIYDHGQYGVFHCTIMEYIEGNSLAQLLNRTGKLPLEQALAIFKQIGSALDFAHARKIIHRDVSPGNVLIDRTGRALLTDFGIARQAGNTVTTTGAIMGTPGYWSPEHARSATAVTHKSDLFGLGVILFVMLTSELPWDDTPGLNQIGFRTPPPLRDRGADRLPAEMDRIMRTLLAIDPEKRYPTAQAAIDDIDRIFVKHGSTTVHVPGQRPAADVAAGASQVPVQAPIPPPDEIETVLGADLKRDPIVEAQRRADQLRRPEQVAALLDAWAARGRLRQRRIGRLAIPRKVSSRNLYSYELKVLVERREPPTTLETPDRKGQQPPLEREEDRWQVALPAITGFDGASNGSATVRGSTRLITCTPCQGKGRTVCPTCNGARRVPSGALPATPSPRPGEPARLENDQLRGVGATGVARPPLAGAGGVATPTPPATSSTVPIAALPGGTAVPAMQPCPTCTGYGGLTCQRCEGAGMLLQRKEIRWERTTATFTGHDDFGGLDERMLTRSCQHHEIYRERVHDAAREEWRRVPGLKRLVDQAVARLDSNSRIVLAEASISFVPVTELLLDLGTPPAAQPASPPAGPDDANLHRMQVYGFENLLPADWRFLNWDRVLLIAISSFLGLLLIILTLFYVLR